MVVVKISIMKKNDKYTKPLFYPKPFNPLYANYSKRIVKESSSNFLKNKVVILNLLY